MVVVFAVVMVSPLVVVQATVVGSIDCGVAAVHVTLAEVAGPTTIEL